MARNSVAYDEDFFAWTEEQARLLRAGELSLLDVENIAEELESMGTQRQARTRQPLGSPARPSAEMAGTGTVPLSELVRAQSASSAAG